MDEYSKYLSSLAKGFEGSLHDHIDDFDSRIGEVRSKSEQESIRSWDSMSHHEQNVYLYGHDYLTR